LRLNQTGPMFELLKNSFETMRLNIRKDLTSYKNNILSFNKKIETYLDYKYYKLKMIT